MAHQGYFLKRSHIFSFFISVLCLGQLLSCSGGGGNSVPSSQPARSWINQSEFGQDPSLKANPGTVVVLNMQHGLGAEINAIPYVFDKDGSYNICIDENDPLITSARLEDSSHNVIAQMDSTNRCKKLTIRAGSYTLHVFNDDNSSLSNSNAFVTPLKADLPIGPNAPWLKSSSAKKALSGGGIKKMSSLPSINGTWTMEGRNGWPLCISTWNTPIRIYACANDLYLAPSSDNGFPLFLVRFPSNHGNSFECGLEKNSWDPFYVNYWDPSSSGYRCCFQVDDDSYKTSGWSNIHIGAGDNCNDTTTTLNYKIVDLGNYSFAILLGFNDWLPSWYGTLSTGSNWGSNRFDEMGFSTAGLPAIENNTFFLSSIYMPSSQFDPSTLQNGQVALYDQPGCTGNVSVVMPSHYQEGGVSHMISTMAQSAMNSRDTWVTLYRGLVGTSFVLNNQIGCINLPFDTSLFYPHGYAVTKASIEYTQDILISSKQCRHCNLYGAQLGNTNLDGIDLSFSYLANADLSNASLKGTNLSNAILSGATLDNANLKGANLCSAFLNGNMESGKATSLVGAYMKNANLARANLSGANMTYASFYSDDSVSSTCASTTCDGSTPWPANCATASGATMNATQLNDAYLTGVDFSGVIAKGVNFSNSILTGANFKNATLDTDPTSGLATSFSAAFIQAADFTSASVKGASFNNAYVDIGSGGKELGFQIKGLHDGFNGFWSAAGSPICVKYGYSVPTMTPIVDSSNTCPDGKSYGAVYCSDGSIPNQGACSGGGRLITEDCWSGTPKISMDKALQNAGFDLCDPFTGVDTNW